MFVAIIGTATAVFIATYLLLPGRFIFQYGRIFYHNPAPPTRSRSPTPPCTLSDSPEDIVCIDPEDTQSRSSFGLGAGAYVLGWPADGGVFVLPSCVGVELDFLRLDGFEPTPRFTDQAEEDAHCERMRMLGAKYWESYRKLAFHEAFGEQTPRDDVVIAGYPAGGGVWVLKTDMEGGMRMGTGRIKNARDMEERCRWIEKLGGRR